MGVIEKTRQLEEGSPFGAVKLARGDYNFADDGGDTGSINLGASIPSGAIILSAYIEVDTVPTSGGSATIALQLESAGDVQAAAAISGAPWSSAGLKLSSARTRASAPLQLTAVRDIVMVIATAALTAGAFRVYVEYIEAP